MRASERGGRVCVEKGKMMGQETYARSQPGTSKNGGLHTIVPKPSKNISTTDFSTAKDQEAKSH